MKIKCENCSVEYEVSDERLSLEHPHFFKCSACGFVFDFKQKQENEDVLLPPPVEQSDIVPMPLSEIFEAAEENVLKSQELEKTDLGHLSNAEAFSQESEENQNSPLFTSWDETDEFMPVSKTKSTSYKRFFVFIFVLLFILGATFYLFYEGRYFFSRKYDFAEVVYQKTGISTDITADGLAFQNTIFDSLAENNGYTLLIKSQIVNTTDAEKKLPVVLINILDEQAKVVQKKEVDLGKNTLSSGEKIHFEEKLSPLADNSKRIELTFKKESK
jgi:hypothetical protein